MRRLLRVLAILTLLGMIAAALGFWTATWDPAVRETRVAMAGWPAGQRPVRIVLLSDIHVAGFDTPPERIARIVGQVNALAPDAVLIAGDFFSHKIITTGAAGPGEIAAPFAALRAPLGTFAVMGNHDHWSDAPAITAALRRVGVRVLFNEAARAGPLAIGGLDDDYTGRADLPATLAAMQVAGGVPVLLSHSPDPFPDVPGPDRPGGVALMLAGHTHCGQVSLPLIGPPITESRYGQRYACGRIDESGKVLVVGAGLGTSGLPLRVWAVPDLWVVTVGPA